MTGHRLPLSELATMIIARLNSVMPTTPFYTFVPQNTPRPYGEIASMTWEDTSQKNNRCKDVVTEIQVVSDDSNMVEINTILESATTALGMYIPELQNNWKVDDVSFEGGGSLVREIDETSNIYWRAVFRLRWKVRETNSAS